jgi:hypothetical protein
MRKSEGLKLHNKSIEIAHLKLLQFKGRQTLVFELTINHCHAWAGSIYCLSVVEFLLSFLYFKDLDYPFPIDLRWVQTYLRL